MIVDSIEYRCGRGEVLVTQEWVTGAWEELDWYLSRYLTGTKEGPDRYLRGTTQGLEQVPANHVSRHKFADNEPGEPVPQQQLTSTEEETKAKKYPGRVDTTCPTQYKGERGKEAKIEWRWEYGSQCEAEFKQQ